MWMPRLREGTVFTNTASAFSEQLDPHDPIHASVATTITEKVDVSVVKQDFPDPAGIGGTIRYELLVSNSGPSDAFDVIITDTLDANTTFVQATLGYNCVENPTGVIECSIPVLPAGESRTIALLVDIATVGLSDGDLLTNNVVVTSDSFDTDPGNNNDESTTTVRAGTDLSVGKVAAEQVIAGEYLTYTIKVNNLGPSLAANVVVTDILPPALVVSTVAFTPSVGTCNLVVNKVVCDLGAMSYPPQSTETITITGQVDPAAPLGQVLVNTAQVDSDTFDFHSFNNDTRFETLVVGRSDLGIVKSGPATATAGLDTITYSLVVTNAGPTQAQNVFVEDPLPPGLTLISVSSTKGTCAAGIACSIGSLSPFGVSGEEVTITVVASVDEDVPDGTLLENIATVSGSVVDDNPFNDQSQADTLISSAATLKISKIDLFDPVEPGGMIFYRIAVTNTGPSSAANVLVTDTLPPGIVFQSASLGCTHDGSATGGDVTCSASSLAVNDVLIHEITAFAPNDVVSGTVLTNNVSADADNADPVDTSEQTTIQQKFTPPVDLEVSKSGDATAVAGGQVTYTVVITNHGPGVAINPDLKDVLPPGATISEPGQCQCDPGLVLPLDLWRAVPVWQSQRR